MPRTRRIVVASNSPMISMAVRAGNLTLERIELVESTRELEDVVQRVLLSV